MGVHSPILFFCVSLEISLTKGFKVLLILFARIYMKLLHFFSAFPPSSFPPLLHPMLWPHRSLLISNILCVLSIPHLIKPFPGLGISLSFEVLSILTCPAQIPCLWDAFLENSGQKFISFLYFHHSLNICKSSYYTQNCVLNYELWQKTEVHVLFIFEHL